MVSGLTSLLCHDHTSFPFGKKTISDCRQEQNEHDGTYSISLEKADNQISGTPHALSVGGCQ
jgi:hypothetical protein